MIIAGQEGRHSVSIFHQKQSHHCPARAVMVLPRRIVARAATVQPRRWEN